MPVTKPVPKLQLDNRHRTLERYSKRSGELPEDLAGRVTFAGDVVLFDGVRVGSIARSGFAVRATLPDGRHARKIAVVAAIRWMLENK